ncbi:glycosyltransferase family 25 protein, partial [Nostoc sp. NIES-2111]
ISLPESVERRAGLLPALAGTPHAVVEAIRGSALGPEELSRAVPKRYSPRVMRRLSHAEIGCALSHLLALRTFLASGHTHALILEDDAVVSKAALASLKAILERHADLDILKVGGFGPFTSRGSHVDTIGPVALIQAVTFGVCAHGYVVTRRAAEKIERSALPIREPFDTFLRNRHRHGCRIFETSPWLVELQPAYAQSTIGARDPERASWLRLVQAALVRCHAMVASRLSNVGDFGPVALFAPRSLPRFPSGDQR